MVRWPRRCLPTCHCVGGHSGFVDSFGRPISLRLYRHRKHQETSDECASLYKSQDHFRYDSIVSLTYAICLRTCLFSSHKVRDDHRLIINISGKRLPYLVHPMPGGTIDSIHFSASTQVQPRWMLIRLRDKSKIHSR